MHVVSRRSQWSLGLRHELSSLAPTQLVGSNPTGGMDVCVCSVRVYSVSTLRGGG
jgi:hypothetical protein